MSGEDVFIMQATFIKIYYCVRKCFILEFEGHEEALFFKDIFNFCYFACFKKAVCVGIVSG